MTASASSFLASKSLKVRDISPAVDERALVFPGDTTYSLDLPSHHQLLAHGVSWKTWSLMTWLTATLN